MSNCEVGSRVVAGPRRYQDGCPVALGMDLVGERWALLIVRELLLGPKRFSDLRAGLLGASADMVTARLRELQASGIVQRQRLPAPASAWVYGLTPWGAELEPVVTAFARWSIRSPAMTERADRPVSVASAVLGLRVLFRSEAAAGATATVELVVADEPFRVDIRDGELDVRRGPAADADLRLMTDPDTLAGLLRGARSMDTEREHGNLELVGDEHAARAFLNYFGPG
jgi:DNA-binding HxlR family transcriptional regulator